MQITLTCAKCGAQFTLDVLAHRKLGLNDLPKACPHCKDGQQGLPPERAVVSRKLIQEFGAVKVCIPAEYFVQFEPGDAQVERGKKIIRASIKGKDIGSNWVGASWSGRLEIFVNGSAELPKIARVRVMEVIREKGNEREEKHGSVQGPKETVVVKYSPSFQYLALDPLPDETEATAALILTSVNYKTTLKGYGRQWHCELDSSHAIWAYEFSNSARSGRFGNKGVVAIVDNDHPVIIRQTGDVQDERAYTLSHPCGMEHTPAIA